MKLHVQALRKIFRSGQMPDFVAHWRITGRGLGLTTAFAAALTLFVAPCWSSDIQYEIAPGYHYFSGVDQKSLAPNTGYLLRFGAGNGNKDILGWVTSMAIVYGSATANFNDAGTVRSLGYTLMGGEFTLGFRIKPFAKAYKLPVQPFFGAAGNVQVDSFNFGTATVSANFPHTEAQQFTGYNLFVGTDLEVGKEWGFQFLVEQANIAGTVGSATFTLGGNRFYFGLFFR